MSRLTTRISSAAFAVFMVAAATFAVGATPAGAAPGDSAAAGLRANLTVTVGVNPAVVLTGVLGEVDAPLTDSADLLDAALLAPPFASVGAEVIHTEANSSATESSALSEVTGALVTVPVIDTLLGNPLAASADVIRARATCPVGGTPTATVDPLTSLVVAGQAVAVDASGNLVINIPSLGNVTLNLKSTTTSTDTAAAAAVQLQFAVNAVGVASVTGTVTIAEASCETPTATVAAPTATGINPNQGPTTGGTPVTITGTGFVPGQTTVTIDGTTVPATVTGPNTLTFTTPPHAAGAVDVTVTTPGGTTAPPLTYTYVPPVGDAPTATNINPNQGPTTGGTTVTVTGTGFVPGQTTVTIDGTTVPATVTNTTTLTFTTPPHNAGPVGVVVSTPGGTTTPPLTYTYVDSAGPVVTPPVGTPPIATPPTGSGSTTSSSTVPDSNGSGDDSDSDGTGSGDNGGSQPSDDGAGSPAPGDQAGPGDNPSNNSNGGSPQGALPRTGSNTNGLLALGLLSLLAGGALVAARRRLLEPGSNRS